MKRILIGLIVVAVVAAGGWFGFNLYVQHRATAEVEAAFEQMRASKAARRATARSPSICATRTLTIEDIAVDARQGTAGADQDRRHQGHGRSPDRRDKVLGRRHRHHRARGCAGPDRRCQAEGRLQDPATGHARLCRSCSRAVRCRRTARWSTCTATCSANTQVSLHRRSRPRPSRSASIPARRRQRRVHLFRTGDPEPQARQDRRDEVGPRRDLGRREAARQAGQADGRVVEHHRQRFRRERDPRRARSADEPATTAIAGSTGRSRQAPMRSNRHRGCEWISTASPWKTSPSSRRNSGWPRYLPRCRRINRPPDAGAGTRAAGEARRGL